MILVRFRAPAVGFFSMPGTARSYRTRVVVCTCICFNLVKYILSSEEAALCERACTIIPRVNTGLQCITTGTPGRAIVLLFVSVVLQIESTKVEGSTSITGCDIDTRQNHCYIAISVQNEHSWNLLKCVLTQISSLL